MLNILHKTSKMLHSNFHEYNSQSKIQRCVDNVMLYTNVLSNMYVKHYCYDD